jgi:hypothetical protein
MNDAADDPNIIDPRLASGVVWQQRLELCKLLLVNQKTSRIIGSLLSETVNHNPIVLGIVMGPDPSVTRYADAA